MPESCLKLCASVCGSALPGKAGARLLLFMLLGWSASPLVAQNLENIGSGKVFGLSGGLNANSVFYDASGMEGRRDPFNYFLSGNLNLSIYDWSIPFSFSYSNQNSSFQQPFNQYGLSPTYKWLTLHAGYRSMMFSNYTMNGHLFLGGGFDVIPNDKIKVSGFYGRLQKAVQEDTTRTNNVPAYRRMGGGVKVTLGNQKNFVDLIVFKAKDEITSLDAPPVKSDVNPEENLVLGFNFGTTLYERLVIKAEYGSSAISKDMRSEEVKAGNVYDKIHFGFRPRASSSYYQAIKSTLQYSFTNVGLGFAYERIDPGYRTLGAYYFNNNLESFALTSTAVLLQKKARVNAQFGVQRNNLDKKELNTMNRLSGSVNVNLQLSPRLMSNLSYSNFQTVINFRSQFTNLNQVSPYENLDTLNYRQIAQNASMNVNYVLNESKEKRQNVNLNLTYQKTSDVQADIEQPTGAKFYNVNANYTIIFGDRNLTLNLAGNANLTKSVQAQNKIYGPSASVRKSFFDKKLGTNLTLSYNNAYVNNQRTSEVTNIRMGANYTWKEKHQFDLGLTRVNRFSAQSETQKRFSELTIQLGYNYNFSLD
jgi:hypothetical protein